MSLQFIAGGSGSGKTRYLYEKVIKESQEHPEIQYLFIVPEQYKMCIRDRVNDIFMPVLSIFTGKIDFSNMFIALDGNKYPTLAAANEVTATINYGAFITQTINFILMAFVVFMVIKGCLLYTS